MLGIIDGLKALHAKNGRHGDFKPQNILHFKKSDEETGGRGTLVIADVGVSRFHKEATRLRHVATAARESTVSYEAPEAEPDRLKGIPRSRKYDMWSIGCMYLEFTIWLVYGNNAVRRFRGRREAKDDPTTTGAWSFFTHNDKGATKIHAAVSEAISILLQDKRCNGTALEDLVILIRDQLLQIDVQQRAEASLLHERFEIIVRAAEEDPSYLWKTLAISPPTPRFFRSRKDFNPTPNTSASDSSTSQDTLSTRSDGSEPT
jgi:serine/threonine protein kinase